MMMKEVKMILSKSTALYAGLYLLMLVCMIESALAFKLANSKESSAEVIPSSSDIHNERILWVQELKQLRKHVKHCVEQTSNTTWSCVKASSVRIVEDILTSNVIPLWAGIRLVRMNTSENANAIGSYNERKDFQHLTWFDRIAMRLAYTLSTHFLQVNLQELTDAYMSAIEIGEKSHKSVSDELGTARHRRQRYNMMITMMFGVTALGAVLVPMGFQMLSIVSGKALLLAKMALLLASINGLKKSFHSLNSLQQVANSGIHYGLYHVPGEPYGGYYDRGDPPHHPRQVTSFAVAQPVGAELGLKR
ncbi:uncharacterized protein Osi23 [Eurosta solidaginis]|uniref:uncharacterized protein Osi23 n=1 Tax=Eurosta solidaginis TaxID=178769 RepID=UPI003530D805